MYAVGPSGSVADDDDAAHHAHNLDQVVEPRADQFARVPIEHAPVSDQCHTAPRFEACADGVFLDAGQGRKGACHVVVSCADCIRSELC